MKYIILLLTSTSLLWLFTAPIFAIQVTEGTEFRPTGLNATFIIGSNATWDRIEVHSTYIVLNNYVISASGHVNVTIQNFTSSYVGFSVNASGTVSFLLDNLAPNTYYTIYRRGLPAWKIQSNSSGGFGFSSFVSGEYGFNIKPSLADGLTCTSELECVNYCLHDFCRETSTYCGDRICDSGETYSSCPNDCDEDSGGGSGPVRSSEPPPGLEMTPQVKSITHIWDRVLPGEMAVMDIDKDIAMTRIQIRAKETARDASVTVTVLEENPVGETIDYVYQYLQIVEENLNNLEKVTIGFKVARTWVSGNSLDRDRIYLKRYVDGWEKLPTLLVNESDGYYLYRAESPGLSYFAISGERAITETTTTTILATTMPATGAVVDTETTVESTIETTAVTTTPSEKIEVGKDYHIYLVIIGALILVASILICKSRFLKMVGVVA